MTCSGRTRCAVAVPDPGRGRGWRMLSGDEVGGLLREHLAGRGLPDGAAPTEAGDGVVVRRSGTQPKLTCYLKVAVCCLGVVVCYLGVVVCYLGVVVPVEDDDLAARTEAAERMESAARRGPDARALTAREAR